ncbi:MAG: hypothetical protein ACYC27_20065 [Armatimonadota bacterium]
MEYLVWVFLTIATVLGLSYEFAVAYMIHKKEMAKINLEKNQINDSSDEYQDFVLGADARFQRLEDRIRLLESKLRQSSESEDVQRINRG